MKLLLFGTGDYYERFKKWFSSENVLALLDNSTEKRNTYIDDIKVFSPADGITMPYDAIVILSFYVSEMKAQLLDLGVPEDKIYHFYELRKLFGDSCKSFGVAEYGDVKGFWSSKEKKVLLLSNDLDFGGPALALYRVCKVLKASGYQVLFASMIDGVLRNRLMDEDIPVIVDNDLQVKYMSEIKWISDVDLVICNTINYHVFLQDRDLSIPIAWWLHDAPYFYHGIKQEAFDAIDFSNIKVYSVGPVPEYAIKQYVPDIHVDGLLYAVADNKNRKKNRDRLIFSTIGFVEPRKGQDILLEAIKNMDESIRDKVEFYFVGQDSSAMAQRLKQETEDFECVHITGKMNREEIQGLLEQTSLLICPSREDPMPTVCAEAMVHEIPCLVSDVTGTAQLIEDGVDGFVFESENSEELRDKITWCINNRDALEKIGIKSRKIYEVFFSEEVFVSKVLELIEDVL